MELEEYLPSRFPTQDKNLGFFKYLNDMFSVLSNRQIISAGLTTISGLLVSEERQTTDKHLLIGRAGLPRLKGKGKGIQWGFSAYSKVTVQL